MAILQEISLRNLKMVLNFLVKFLPADQILCTNFKPCHHWHLHIALHQIVFPWFVWAYVIMVISIALRGELYPKPKMSKYTFLKIYAYTADCHDELKMALKF